MKKIICILSSVLALSCAKNNPSSNPNDSNNTSDTKPSTNPNPNPEYPIVTPPPHQDLKPDIVKLKFGNIGQVTLNNDTGKYNIDKMPTNRLDFDFLQPVKRIFDSYVKDPIYFYKSSLFPVDRHSLFQIPKVLNYNTIDSVDSRPSNNKYDVSLQFWGETGSKKDIGYYVCYKSIDNTYAKFDFIVEERDDLYSNPSCDMYKKLIDDKKVTPLDFKGGDFILLKFSGFRAYTDGECFDNATCKISYNINIKYFTQIK